MDRRERYQNLMVAVKSLIRQERADLWTALPAYVVSYDATALTVQAQPAIQAQVRQQNGPNADETWGNVTLPVCPDVPVCFPGGGGFLFTFPLAASDEGILILASRCIDAWWQQSGVQPQAELRMHDLSDGMFIPNLRSKPKVPSGISTTHAQLLNSSGVAVLDIDPAGDVAIKGNLTVVGNITAGQGGSDQVDLFNHTHQYLKPATGTPAQTNPPMAGT